MIFVVSVNCCPLSRLSSHTNLRRHALSLFSECHFEFGQLYTNTTNWSCCCCWKEIGAGMLPVAWHHGCFQILIMQYPAYSHCFMYNNFRKFLKLPCVCIYIFLHRLLCKYPWGKATLTLTKGISSTSEKSSSMYNYIISQNQCIIMQAFVNLQYFLCGE